MAVYILSKRVLPSLLFACLFALNFFCVFPLGKKPIPVEITIAIRLSLLQVLG